MYQNNCKKCDSSDLFTKSSGNNIGLYCSDCGAWIKWLNKNELRAFEESKRQKDKLCTYMNYESLSKFCELLDELGIPYRNKDTDELYSFDAVLGNIAKKWNSL